MGYRSIGVIAAFAVMMLACRESPDPSAPDLDREELLRLDAEQLDCRFDAQRCAIIQAGINTLREHANAECRLLGDLAQDRYDAPASDEKGYREAAQVAGKDMGVNINITNGLPTDRFVNVFPSFWNNPFIGQPLATGALLAHEEYHHLGFSESQAEAVQDRCRNSQG